MHILSIDTSQKVCSVALHNEAGLLADYQVYSEKVASGKLSPMIRHLLENCDLQAKDLSAIAVAQGPGSYTGLRIAVSTAKGLCAALDIPLIAINTLEAMAHQELSQTDAQTWVVPMLDARRMEVYVAAYDHEGIEKLNTRSLIITKESLTELLGNQSVILVGDGAQKCEVFLQELPNIKILEKPILPLARYVGSLAIRKFDQENFENLVTFEPFYLKEFIGVQSK